MHVHVTIWWHFISHVQVGNSLPALRTQHEALDALKKVGFQVLDSSDVANDGDLPWFVLLMSTCAVFSLEIHILRQLV